MKSEVFRLFVTPFGTYEPHPKQLLIHDGLEAYRTVYALYGRQTGKTVAAAMEAAYALLVPHTDGAPHEVSLVSDRLAFAEKIFEAVEFIYLNTPDLNKRIKSINNSAQKKRIELKNGAVLRAKSSHNPTSLAGDTVSFLITEESGFVSDKAMSLVRPTIAVREGKHLAIGTADVESQWFKNGFLAFKEEGERFQRGEAPQGDAVAFHASSLDNPLFKPEELEAIRKNGQTTEREIKLLYLAQFEDDDKRAISSKVVEQATRLKVPKRNRNGEYNKPDVEGRSYVAGVDIARYVDYTVISVIDVTEYPARLVYIERWNKTTPEMTAKKVASILSYFNALAYIDSTGVGDVYVEMIRRFYNNVRPFTFTATSKNPLIEGLIVKLEQEDLLLFPDEVLMKEIEKFVIKRTPSGHITYAAESGHDDTVISLALAAQGIRTAYDYKRPRIRLL